jgi:hypothetical protein
VLLHAKEGRQLQARLQAHKLAPVTALHHALEAPLLCCTTDEGSAQVWDSHTLQLADAYPALHKVLAAAAAACTGPNMLHA